MHPANQSIEETVQELKKTKDLGSFIKGAWAGFMRELGIETSFANTRILTANDPAIQGLSHPSERVDVRDGMIIHTDVIIPTRDGTKLRGNIYRPETHNDQKLPVLLNYSVYGKDMALEPCMFPKSSGLDNSHYTPYYQFEACDTPWWTQRGYIVAYVDARGSFQSEGDKSYYSRDVALDGYDIIEWLAVQEWASGKVGMYGASAFAMLQWQVAAENPPSLAAILPFDGMTDLYREMARKGGIPETQFMAVYPHLYNWGRGLVEDSGNAHFQHPFFDDYWRSKIPRLDQIKCPAYVVSCWGDQGIHTRGTLNGWKQIGSTTKYLEIHPYQKWEFALTEESLTRQKAFYDTFLHGKETEVKFWPPVRWAMRESFYNSEWRYATTFPFPQTEYVKLYPTPAGGLSQVAQPTEQNVSYDAQTGEVTFEVPFTESYEFAGHAKLRLWVEARGADNMDLFIVLKKKDASGNEVHFPWLTIIDNGPIAFGHLRVSRRELDESKSTEFQPYHSHQKDLLLEPGQVVPVDIEILPSSCRFRPGDTLQVSISGHDYGKYPPMIPVARHTKTVNKGAHVIHFGGKHESFLQLPGIPPGAGSSLCHGKTIKMALLANRVKGWNDEKFLEEYLQTHAGMTAQVSNMVPFLRAYTQVAGVPKASVETFSTDQSRFEIASILGWSSLAKLGSSFKHPGYRASAGQHEFADPELAGSLSQAFEDIMFDPVLFKDRQDSFKVVVFLAKASEKNVSDYDLQSRSDALKELGSGTGLIRYVLNRDVTPSNPREFFKDTQFENGDWGNVGAMEQYWFRDEQSAVEFFANSTRVQALQSLPSSFDPQRTISVTGREVSVVAKDLNF
ncbi:Peptidase S15/CocE/NonD C-terminal [Penicillium odoratum]|uniref:Peptidase S15/CocE/NonD C-terminal n=1 Tax=Penicillium odoratum TaxID=1167516 RepID=UPI0025469ECC|nr:Peptidase S15/CocE/NonD C-terminal [Penicillium odoratum]KAJ5761284.1 Peptidase S15/CocE/NonD C-terminal [Penicillium odoratum]